MPEVSILTNGAVQLLIDDNDGGQSLMFDSLFKAEMAISDLLAAIYEASAEQRALK